MTVERQAITLNPQCPLLTCPDCDVPFMGRPGDECPRCGKTVGERAGLPWQGDYSRDLEWVGAFWRTIVAVHRPSEAFAEFKRGEDPGPPAVFGYLTLLLGVFESLATNRAALGVCGIDLMAFVQAHGPRILVKLLTGFEDISHNLDGPFAPFAMLVLLVSIGLAFLIGIGSVVLTPVLRLISDGPVRTSDTFAVFAYSLGGTSVWLALPGVGAAVWLLLGLRSLAYGLTALTRVSPVRALAGVALLGLAAGFPVLCVGLYRAMCVPG